MKILNIFLFNFMIMLPAFCVGETHLGYGRSQVGFAEKVNAYVQRVRSGNSGKEGIGEVLGRAMLLTPYSSMKSLITILNHLGPFLIKDKDAAANEACCASFIKIVVPIVEQFDQELFKNLYMIDSCLGYWEHQRIHPISYFLHKSPLKYFTLRQQEEVANKIQFLKDEQWYYFALLGKINIHLSSFNANSSVEDQYIWIQQLCRILFSYDVTSFISPDEELFPLLHKSTNLVDNYRMHMNDRLSKYLVPSVIMRRWLEGVTVIAGLGYGGLYANNHRDTLQEYKNRASDIMQAAKTVALGNDGDEKAGHSFYGLEMDEILDGKKTVNNEGSGKNGKQEVGTEEKVVDTPQLTPMMAYTYHKENILGAQGDRNDLEDLKNMIRAGKEKQSRVAWHMFRFYKDVGIDGIHNIMLGIREIGDDIKKKDKGWAKSLVDIFVANDLPQKTGEAVANLADQRQQEKVPFTVSDSLKKARGTFSLSIDLWKVEHPRIWALIRTSPFTLSLGAAALGMYKVYKKIHGVPNYDPLHADLVNMALLLNVYGDAHPADMDACDFGKLVYLAYKLQREEGRVPKQYRADFMNEVSLLKRSTLTADQKMKVIDLMYKKYPFLAQQGVPGA